MRSAWITVVGVFAFAGILFAASVIPKTEFPNIHTESRAVILSDTSTFKIRNDILRFVLFDTLKITKTLKDTLLVVKIDTVKVSSKPIQIR
jgi:hypothetical protein